MYFWSPNQMKKWGACTPPFDPKPPLVFSSVISCVHFYKIYDEKNGLTYFTIGVQTGD
jgi:hypothetical protein